MSNSFVIAKPRRIEKHGIETPFLIPSFSSRGFPNISDIMETLRVDISNACLLSAFDIANGYTSIPFDEIADVVVIDSGVYETSPGTVAVDAFLPSSINSDWTRDKYRGFLVQAAPRMANTSVLVVSFDTYSSLEEQIRLAREDFKLVPHAASTILIKPESVETIHGSFSGIVDNMRGFDIIGITERELGYSAIDRCLALLKLRKTLEESGVNIPIHVFGSITPAAVSAYFLCGADIFDGLNWLRVGLDGSWVGAPSEFAVTSNLFDIADGDVMLELWQRNLKTIHKTQSALRRFATDGDIDALVNTLPFASHSMNLANQAKQHLERG